MVYKDLYMSELDVFSEGKRSMDLMHLGRKRRLAGHVTAGQGGAVCVVVLERTRKEKERENRR